MPNAPRRARASDAPTEVTAAPVEPRPERVWLVALGIAAVGAIAGMLFLHYRNPPPGAGFAAFATLYVLAQAIERILEPLSLILDLGHGHARARGDLLRARVGARDGCVRLLRDRAAARARRQRLAPLR